MGKETYIFKRYEKKYLVTDTQKARLLADIRDFLVPDSHGKSTIYSLYLDTPNYQLIRASIEAKTYKEKLRIRAYGHPSGDSAVYFEIKKKFQGVVYKRRVRMTYDRAMTYLETGVPPVSSQIMREIEYAMTFYGRPKPSMLITYDREAYFAKEDASVRITFDTNVQSSVGFILLPGQFVLEVKTEGAMPLWLSHALNELEIYPSSFSKYGTAYKEMLHKGEMGYVSNF